MDQIQFFVQQRIVGVTLFEIEDLNKSFLEKVKKTNRAKYSV